VEATFGGQEGSLTVPRTAVLWTGKRSIVYVKQPDAPAPTFALREVELGPSLGDAYIILSGMEEGEEIVVSGAFAVDASAQLEGKRSMMNSEAVSTPPAQATFAVQGLCEMCKERIEQAAGQVSGVARATWDMESRKLHLSYDPSRTSPEAVSAAVSRSGHDTDMHQADHATYNSLPDCCRYREE
jgi:Cu(I)/Ag(I) efflux system membrane fusion protein